MKRESRRNNTDRVLVAIALLLLLLSGGAFYFDSWMWDGARSRGDRIGFVRTRTGDVRMKFEGDLRWRKAPNGQDVAYNDSIFAGDKSKAELELGESQMTVDENTLVVLRRNQDVNFLNLNYGTLFGRLAKNDKIIVDTGQGAPIELSAKGGADIVIKNVDGKVALDVTRGEAKVTINGKTEKVTRAKSLQIASAQTTQKSSLQIVRPTAKDTVYSETPLAVPFVWKDAHPSQARHKEEYTMEFSAMPNFEAIRFNKLIKGHMETTLQVSQTLSYFYRIKRSDGSLSNVEKFHFVRIQPPLIIYPRAEETYMTPRGLAAAVEIQFKPPPESKTTWYQIATDREFQKILINRNTDLSMAVADLPVGEYFIRARSNFGEERLSSWSQMRPFFVKPILEDMRLTSNDLLTRVVIPNRSYPSYLYKASRSSVQSYLAQKGLLNRFFNTPAEGMDSLKIEFDRGRPREINQTDLSWPAAKLYPDKFDYRYQFYKDGYKPSDTIQQKQSLEIVMEPPRLKTSPRYSKNVDDEGWRKVKWGITPLLFASSYDVELSPDLSFSQTRGFNTTSTEILTKLPAGTKAYWRARARDSRGRIISDFSNPSNLNVPEAPRAPAVLAKDDEAENRSRAKQDEVKDDEYNPTGWWAWIGGGYNYIRYGQEATVQGESIDGVAPYSLTTGRYNGPGLYFESGYAHTRKGWGGVVSYKNTPGEVLLTDSSGVNIVDVKEYNWRIISLEGVRQRVSKWTLFGSPIRYGLRAGFQQHSMPFLVVAGTDVADEVVVKLKQSEMLTGSLGILSELHFRKWTHYWFMRYQLPLSSSVAGADSYSYSPTVAFDGLVGTAYNLNMQTKLGLFWYGQYHQYDYQVTDGDYTAAGTQSLFFSNLDLRLGFDF